MTRISGLAFMLMFVLAESALAGAFHSVTGSVTYRERIALPPDARVEVKLLDVSLQDVLAKTLAEQTIAVTHQVPIAFELAYDPAQIREGLSYAVRATIYRGDTMLFTTDRHYGVLTRGAGDHVDLVLIRVAR